MPHSTSPQRPTLRKKGLKGKIVQLYEALFNGEDPSRGNLNFWSEIFLMKIDVSALESEIGRRSGEELISAKENINSLFQHCLLTLKEKHEIKILNSLQTLCVLVSSVFNHSANINRGFDVIDLLMDFENAEKRMSSLVEGTHDVITGSHPIELKRIALKLILILVTAVDNVSQNTILEYLMMFSVFETCTHVLSDPSLRLHLGYEVVFLLAVLVNYRKYESANPYIIKLSILDDAVALNGTGLVISNALTEFNKSFVSKDERSSEGFLTTLTTMVTSMFVAESDAPGGHRPTDFILLALYEAVHLNRNFISVLTHCHTTQSTCSPPSPHEQDPEAPSNPTPPPEIEAPSNLLVTFLQYASYVLDHIKTDTSYNDAKLCLIILSCICEDQFANAFLHDMNMIFRVPLHRASLRHRKYTLPEQTQPARPLVATLFDLISEFLVSHLMKNLPIDLYVRCVGIVHRILCYQKRCRVRLQYSWSELWSTLITVLKFILSNESSMTSRQEQQPQCQNILTLAVSIVNLINLFITYGDTFLPSPASYDELYYEIIRMHELFDRLYTLSLRHASNAGPWKDAAVRLNSNLVNIRSIINHFNPKIENYRTEHRLSTISQEQVMEVVRSNYDSLTLKLQDSLDQFERFSEKPREISFFTQQVRAITHNCRRNISLDALAQETVLQQFSSIH